MEGKKSRTKKTSIDIPTSKTKEESKPPVDYIPALIKLKEKAIKIMEVMLPIMQELADEDSEIVKEIKFCCKSPETVEWLQEQTLEAVSDARAVNLEIDKFIEIYRSGTDNIEKHTKEFPFIAGVWFGDVYDDKEEIEAINELVKEFKTQYTLISKDGYFIEIAKKYKGKK